MAFYPIQNQLQFNLDVPSNQQNLAFKFHRPHPIMIDKGGGPPGVIFPPSHTHQLPPGGHDSSGGMNLSSMSEDRMSIAVILAQRDMRKKKEEENMKKQLGKSRPRSRSPPPKSFGKTKVVRDRASRDRMRRQQVKTNVKYKEHDRNQSPKNAKTQTPPRMSRPGILGRVPDLSMPVSSQSPPSRDTDFKLYAVPRSAPSAQPEKEIERLQHEMEGYLQQIQVIEQRAMNDQNTSFLQPSRQRQKDGYLEKEEAECRKHTRMEELTARTSRQLYMLRQQVREMQNEYIRVGPEKIKHTKKSRRFAHLAAAHRGAVRAIQSFVTNLPHTDLSAGLPSTYHELALLIRQMTLLSNQVSAEKSSVQGDLLKMLDKVDDLNKAWCKDLPEKESAKSSVTKVTEPQRPPPTRQEPPRRGQPVQRTNVGKENRPTKGIIKPSTAGLRRAEKPKQVTKDGTPDRKAAMRAGIAALVEAGQLKKGRAGMAWDVSGHQPSQVVPKSLILPAKLQERRARAQRTTVQAIPDVHFADPTISSNLKSLSPQRNLIMERSFSAPPTPSGRGRSVSPGQREPWRPGGTPGRTASRGRRRTRSQSPALQRCLLIKDMLDGDVVKTLFPDDMENEQQQKKSVVGVGRQSPHTSRRERQARSQSPTDRLMRQARSQSPTERLVSNAEMAIQRRLQPLLDQAEEIACRQEQMLAVSDPTFRRGLVEEISNPEERRDVLTEMILQDVMSDTAMEFQALERQERAEKAAAALQDRPSLENLMYRLEQMEEERHNIRRRWASVQFSETEPKPRRNDVGRPLAPAAMEITRHTVPPRTIQKNMARDFIKEDEPIIFTKMKSEAKFTERKTAFQTEIDEVSLKDSAYAIRSRPEVQITLPRNVLDSIQSGVEAYERYLKKTSHQHTARFDPWRLMEEVADHVLDDCLADIATELEDLNEAIVTNVCKSEFLVPQESGGSSPASLGPTTVSPGPAPGSPGHTFASPIHTSARPAPQDSPTMVVFRDQPVHFSLPADDDVETSVKHKDDSNTDQVADSKEDDYDVDDDDFEDYDDDDDYEDVSI